MKIANIGYGTIGTHVQRRLVADGHQICLCPRGIHTHSQFSEWLAHEKPQAVFITISTRDTGEGALEYFIPCIQADIPVFTCEKGALAYHADKLRPHLASIGFSASVGGGTMMLEYLKNRHVGTRPVSIDMVVNGTLNYIFFEMGSNPQWFSSACHEMVRRCCTEPGAQTPVDIVNSELRDIQKKICVVSNTILSKGQIITPQELDLVQITAHDITQLHSREQRYRFIVSFANYPQNEHHRYFGTPMQFYDVDGWHMIAGFREVTASERLWLPGKVDNAIQISEGHHGCDGVYTLTGPGAGPAATVSALIADFKRLCHIPIH